MTQNFFKTISFVKTNVLRTIHLNPIVRCYGISKATSPGLRFGNLINRWKELHTKKTISTTSKMFTLEYKLEQNTNVANNVILWKYEGTNYYKNLKIFATLQMVVLAGFSISIIPYLPRWNENENFREYLKKSFTALLFSTFPIVTGIGGFWLIWFYLSRSLKTIILHKGGKNVTLITYHPRPALSKKVFRVEDVTVRKNRAEVRAYLPLRIKNTSLFHLMDRKGVFINPMLFDHTIGVARDEDKSKNK